MIRSSFRRIIGMAKNALLPRGKAFRRVRFGPAAGCVMMLDLQYELRTFLGVYERELLPHYHALLRPGLKSFDVGGNNGYTALLIASITRKDVASFDCERAAVIEMRKVFERNDLPIVAVEAFVGRDTGEGRITLDDAAEQFFVPDFIKMDVEGAEVDVLLGAQRLLATRKPDMIVEVHGQKVEAECIKILVSHGYKPTIVDPSRFFPENRPLAFNRWLVCRRSENLLVSRPSSARE